MRKDNSTNTAIVHAKKITELKRRVSFLEDTAIAQAKRAGELKRRVSAMEDTAKVVDTLLLERLGGHYSCAAEGTVTEKIRDKVRSMCKAEA